jgi:hypothetical protein
MSLSREDFLKHVDKRIGRVDVPEMGGEVCVASLTVAEADQIRGLGEDGIPAGLKIAILCVCDESGKRLFTMDDVEALKAMPATAIGAIATAALKHNGLNGDSSEEAKNVSGAAESDDSASD